MTKVVIADPIHQDAIDLLKQKGLEVQDVSDSKGKLMDVLPGAEGIVVRSATKVTTDFLDSAPDLKIIARSGVGLDNINLDECEKRNIKVVNSPEGPSRSVAELALGLMIGAARKFAKVIMGTKSGEWPKKTKGTELHGKTLGVIGTGSIGGVLTKYAIALGMDVIGYDIITYDELEKLPEFKYEELDELLEEADVISTHVPLVENTKHMISDEQFDTMKDGVIIINTSRGGVIDENALYHALESGKVAGVGLDVYENEPVDASSPLISHPHVVTTAHIGAQTPEASRKNSMVVSEKIIAELINE